MVRKFKYILLSILAGSMAVSYLAWFRNPSVAVEDGLFETAGAICCLLASLFFFFQYLKDTQRNDFFFLKTKKNIFYLLLAIMFFFAFGEELSWGQRMFNFQTPGAVKQVNLQGETTIHNLALFNTEDATGKRKTGLALFLNFDRLFALFWLCFCFLVPLAGRFSASFSRWLAQINLPMVPLGFGALLILNHLAPHLIKAAAGLSFQIAEIKEYNIEFAFMLVGIYFLTSAADPAKTEPAAR